MENTLNVRFSDADTIISHGNRYDRLVGDCPDLDHFIGGAEFERVVDQLKQDLGDPIAVTQHGRQIADADFDPRDSLAGRSPLAAKLPDSRLDGVLDTKRLDFVRLHGGYQLPQVSDHPFQSGDGGDSVPEQFL